MTVSYTHLRTVGNVITGKTIPWIIPYWERALLHEIPDFSSLDGIINCFSVERPERIYDVRATENAIFKILNLCPKERTSSSFFSLISIIYKIKINVNEHTSEITSAKISEMQIASTPLEILILSNIIVATIFIVNSKICVIAFLYAFLTDVK